MSLAVAKSAAVDFYAAQFAVAQAQRGAAANAPWLAQARQRALDEFLRLGFPTTRHEEWKYSNLALLERRQYAPAPANPLFDPAIVHAHDVLGGHLLVFVNGYFQPALSRLPPAGVGVETLAAAIERDASSVRARLEPALTGPWRHGLAALNAALFRDGAVISIPASRSIDAPIHLLHVTTAAEVSVQPLNLIQLDAAARALVVEQHVAATEGAYWSNSATRIALGEEAALDYVCLASESAKAYRVATIDVTHARASRLRAWTLALGGLFARTDVAVRLAAPGSECTVNGMYVTAGREHVDFHTYIDHLVPDTVSRENFKGVLDGASRAVFNGKVMVHADAQRSDAQQSNKNLLLSEDAEIDTKPQLEIFADDVKCSHGATIGQLDENQVFYLRSRGLSESAARSVLTFAFCEELVLQLPNEALRRQVNRALLARLPVEQSHLHGLGSD